MIILEKDGESVCNVQVDGETLEVNEEFKYR